MMESEQSSAEACTSEKNMEFVRRTMLSAKVQDIVAKVDFPVQNFLVAMNRSDPKNLQRCSRALKTILALGMGHLDHISQRFGWPNVVKNEIEGRVQEIAKTPLESFSRRMMQMLPVSWGAECSTYVQWAYEIIDMIHSAVTIEDWSLIDCQEYLMDLEMSVTKAVAVLEVAGLGLLREDQVEALWERESQALYARELAMNLRHKRLESPSQPAATSTPISQASSRTKPSKMWLAGLAAERSRVMGELRAGTECWDHRKERSPVRPSAPMLRPMDQGDSSKESWPWFSGKMEDTESGTALLTRTL